MNADRLDEEEVNEQEEAQHSPIYALSPVEKISPLNRSEVRPNVSI